MVKTKVIIHLSPMGTQSQNIEEYIKIKMLNIFLIML